jgi:hypothetical protein
MVKLHQEVDEKHGSADLNLTSTVSGGFSPVAGSKVFVFNKRFSPVKDSDE